MIGKTQIVTDTITLLKFENESFQTNLLTRRRLNFYCISFLAKKSFSTGLSDLLGVIRTK